MTTWADQHALRAPALPPPDALNTPTAGPTKRCGGCGEYKPLDAFSPHPNGVQGRQGQCKPCKAAARRRKYRKDSQARERDRAQSDAYNAALAELRDRHREEFDDLYAAARREQGLS